MKKFIEIDHTGDIAFKAFGKDLKSLFENAAFALYSHIVDLNSVQEKKEFHLQVKGNDINELIINWLNELNFLTEIKLYVFSKFAIKTLSDISLVALVKGTYIL